MFKLVPYTAHRAQKCWTCGKPMPPGAPGYTVEPIGPIVCASVSCKDLIEVFISERGTGK